MKQTDHIQVIQNKNEPPLLKILSLWKIPFLNLIFKPYPYSLVSTYFAIAIIKAQAFCFPLKFFINFFVCSGLRERNQRASALEGTAGGRQRRRGGRVYSIGRGKSGENLIKIRICFYCILFG